jgi:hypothetical protein
MDAYVSDPQTRKRKIECKPELVIASLQKFYTNHPEIDKVLTYLNGEAPLSLRIIDWFVTKYSRKTFVRYPLNGQEFLVYLSYKGQLKAYSKQYFDPNCRRERIMFKIPNYDQFMTTIGKLNFFRWALESNILNYIEAHEEEIRKGYNVYLKEIMVTQKRNKTESKDKQDKSEKVNDVNDANNAVNDMNNAVNEMSDEEEIMTIPHKGVRTTRRRTKQSPSSLTKLQVYTTPIELSFD